MEAVEELPIQSSIESVKASSVVDGEPVLLAETGLCHTSNGVAELAAASLDATDSGYSIADTLIENADTLIEAVAAQPSEHTPAAAIDKVVAAPDTSSQQPEQVLITAMETTAAVETLLNENKANTEVTGGIIESSIDTSEAILCNEVTIEGSNIEVDSSFVSPDKVTLRTEILVEKSEDDNLCNDTVISSENANNILSDLDQGIELSEVLRSSDTTNNGENNNGNAGIQVFNKEELLDILEGNDEIPMSSEVEGQTEQAKTKRMLESQIALKQLSRLQRASKPRSPNKAPKDETPKKKRGRKKENKDSENIVPTKIEKQENSNSTKEIIEEVESSVDTVENKNDSIVNTLVKDWDDDEPPEADQSNQTMDDSNKITDQTIKIESDAKNSEVSADNNTDSPTVEGEAATQSKSGDDNQLHRGRIGRVIKKKVIFDPDNPDTFTKGKVIIKTKEPQLDKEQPPTKKVKPDHTVQRAKSKSPTSKQQWKKPAAKNSCKQNRRLTEVDKLLMDEGAVNMIYQLTPEAPKGKKNMRTKAEIIKKMQSSTPEGNKETMKFRERKKEVKGEGEPKKIVGGKSSRSSISGSVKSPSVNEDFETHSADDSIIYRRHSSSSYSSTCMSPRRLSDVEGGSTRVAAPPATPNNTLAEKTIETDISSDVFMADAASETINKDDCLSIKEKLNTKLSLVLKKRKRESTTKTEKPPKQKRAAKNISLTCNMKTENIEKFHHLSINFDQRLAEICIRKSGSVCSIEMLKEFEQALLYVDNRKDILVTLFTSECGTLCSELDLQPLLGDKLEARTNYAHALAERVRSVLCAVDSHNKLVVSCVWGACAGVSLALVALSDVALATDQSTFAVGAAPPLPGQAALVTPRSRLSQAMVNDLVVFGRCVSAREAERGGLIARCAHSADALRALAADIAAQPSQSILLKKQLLNMTKSSDSVSTFLTGLEKECDLLVQYWTSVEGQAALRAALHT